MSSDCIFIPKEFIIIFVIIWGIFSLKFLGKKDIDDNSNRVKNILFWLSLIGAITFFATMLMYIIIIIIQLLSSLPCIRVG